MALSEGRIQKIQEAQTAVGEWKDRRVQELEAQVDFLRSVKTSVPSLADVPQETATKNAEDLLKSILES